MYLTTSLHLSQRVSFPMFEIPERDLLERGPKRDLVKCFFVYLPLDTNPNFLYIYVSSLTATPTFTRFEPRMMSKM